MFSVAVGFEFLTTYPLAYLHRSFNLGRQFEYKWTVNWRFLPEHLFLDRRLHLALLVLHLSLLVIIFNRVWFRSKGNPFQKGLNCFTVRNLIWLHALLFVFFSTCNSISLSTKYGIFQTFLKSFLTNK